MRTTIKLRDETHIFASDYAHARGLTLGAAIDELIRKAQTAPQAATPEIQFSAHGFPIFPPAGRTITEETVKQLAEEEFDPEAYV